MQNGNSHNSSNVQQPGKVISILKAREIRDAEQNEELAYKAKILTMTKLDLLEEMIRFNDERSTIGMLTLPLMIRGRILFKALEETAETEHLRLLTRSYRRHLDFELAHYRKSLS